MIFLGIANPKSIEYPNNQDEEKNETISFLDTNGCNFPTLFDKTGEILNNYYITALLTTFMLLRSDIIYPINDFAKIIYIGITKAAATLC